MIRLDHVDMVKSASAWGRKVIFSDFGMFVGVRWAGLWMVSGLLLSKQNRNKKTPLFITKRGFFMQNMLNLGADGLLQQKTTLGASPVS